MDWIKFVLFLCLIIYPLGYIVTSWLTKVSESKIAVSVTLGLFLVSIEAYLSGILKLPGIIIPLIILQAILSWILILKSNNFVFTNSFRIPGVVWIFVLLAVFVNCQMLIPFGRVTDLGISLFGAHFVDSTWHIALINNLGKSIPPENPIFSGTLLTNYHYLVDLQISLIHRVTQIPVPQLYFSVIGPFYIFVLTTLVYRFANILTKSIIGGISSILVLLLGSNWYYLFGANPSIAWVDFFSTKTVNYPLLFSLCLSIVFIELITNSKSKIRSVVIGLLIGFSFLIKSHTAVVLIISLGIYGFIKIFNKNSYPIIALLSSFFVLVPVFMFTMNFSSGVLRLFPLWFIKTMYESPDRLNQVNWELKRLTLSSYKAYLGIAKLYIAGIATFLIINFGPLSIGLISKKITKYMLIVVIVSIFIPLLVIQNGAPWNSIQFIYVAYIPLTLGVAILISKMYRQNRLLGLMTMMILFASLLPGNKYIIDQYAQYLGRYNIPPDQVELIKFLKTLPGSTIVTDTSFFSGSYIQAYTGKSLFVGDSQMLESLAIDANSRLADFDKVFECIKIKYSIDYIVVTGDNVIVKKCYKLIKDFPRYSVYSF